ncbi:hypothetical protein [Cellulophaga fucicola]|uniref:DltD C-terminal region n=1 Tax=Cellulophaga fucicola TaxID=76595 RepID=A0A1K1M011_9FLAO|nr:hypothetical protein [Cellulophaga fucicola]SFW16424.1 hypothetical protein SAMN05660313_00223 [Cellulophaga fucicola]
MKHFLLKIILFCVVLTGVYFSFMYKVSTGYVDENYPKFCQEAGSLIIGVSTASQGISPQIFEDNLSEFNLDKPMVNFAINFEQSQYGDTYLNAIENKLKKSTKKGLFILSVSPISFSSVKNLDESALEKLDKEKILGKITNFTSAPNFDYISNCYPISLYNAFYPTNKWDNLVAHPNGWNEFKLKSKSYTVTEEDITNWKKKTIEFQDKFLKTQEISKIRFLSFAKTIDYLKQKGDVFIVRMPLTPENLKLENEKWENFNYQFDSIAKVKNISFLDYSETSSEYNTYDGTHMVSESAKKFSKTLSDDVKSILLSDSKKK